MVKAKDVRRLRDRLEESQKAFAKRFGVNQSTVARWEDENDGPPDSGPAVILLSNLMGRVFGKKTAAAA